MSDVDTVPLNVLALAPSAIQDPAFDVRGTLYFLEAHYLFRWKANGGIQTKFVTSNDLAAAFSQAEEDSGWVPSGVVRVGNSAKGPWYVYTAPAQKVTITLNPGEEPVTVPIPRTVLMGIGPIYYLWATRGVHFSPDDPAYHAPFPNVHSEGMICWGANSPGQAAAKAARGIWELFFSAPFTKDLANGKSGTHPDDVREALRGLDKKKSYPLEDLVATNDRIGFLVSEILRR